VTTLDVDQGTMDPNDDSYSEQLYFGFSINFLGRTYDQLYVNNNGNITFDSPLGTYSPQELKTNYGAIIAPFFADVDTRDDGVGTITYAPLTVNDHKAYKVSWNSVGYYNEHYDKRNTFSVTLIDRRDVHPGDFDIDFDYGSITWDTGDASGGLNGLADPQQDPYFYPARAGWSNGTGRDDTYFEYANSGQAGAFLGSGPPSPHHFEIRNPWVDLTAHRTGGKFGEAVSDEVEDGGDPTQYLILTNNDFEEPPDGDDPDNGARDYDDDVAFIPTGTPSDDEDDDLAQMTLSMHFPSSSSNRQGTIAIEPSYWSAVRLFRGDGTELPQDQWSVDLANPTGYLAPLATGGTVDVWMEGVQTDSNFVFSVVQRDENYNEVSRDDVHMTIAQWNFLRQDGEVDAPVTLTGLGALQDATENPDASTPVAGAMAFKSQFQGLSDEMVNELRVFDPTNPDDYFVDTVSGAQSELWAAAYIAGYNGEILSEDEQTALRDQFGLNAVDPPADGPKGQLTTPADVQTRKLKNKLPVWSMKNDAANWTLPDGTKPTYEQDFRKWLGGQFGSDGGAAGIRNELWKLVAAQGTVNGAPCSQAEQWPLLYFAAYYGLPVQFVTDNGTVWKNHTINQGKATSVISTKANTAALILTELQKFGSFQPQNMLNWRVNSGNWVTLTPQYTSEAWTVSPRTQDIPWRSGETVVGQGMTDHAWDNVGMIQPGDVVMTVALDGWPYPGPAGEDGQWQQHAEFITNVAANGAPGIDTQVYLMYDSSHDNAGWPTIGEIIKPPNQRDANYLNSHGHQYVIRSLNFAGFDQMWPA